MENKIYSFIQHCWKICFSAAYRRKMALGKGQEIWKRIDKELPPAVGAIINDAPRVEMFRSIVKILPSTEKKRLQQWLEHEIYELEHNFAEHSTGAAEEHEARMKQIYGQHLEVMS